MHREVDSLPFVGQWFLLGSGWWNRRLYVWWIDWLWWNNDFGHRNLIIHAIITSTRFLALRKRHGLVCHTVVVFWPYGMCYAFSLWVIPSFTRRVLDAGCVGVIVYRHYNISCLTVLLWLLCVKHNFNQRSDPLWECFLCQGRGWSWLLWLGTWHRYLTNPNRGLFLIAPLRLPDPLGHHPQKYSGW